ncbi:hypothetical protein GCM10009616_16930 [Microlunatus lacustris]
MPPVHRPFTAGRAAGPRGLEPTGRVHLLSLLVPLAGYLVLLKTVRIRSQLQVPTLAEGTAQLASDALVALAFGLFWAGVLAPPRRPAVRRAGLALAHLSAVAVGLWATLAHLYHAKTGSLLDLAVLGPAWASRGEIGGLLESGVTSSDQRLLVLVALYLAAGPFLVERAWVALTGARAGLPVRTRRPAAVTTVLASVLVLMASLPASTASAFARDPLLQAVLGPLETRRFAAPAGAVLANPGDELPDARLVETPRTEQRNVVLVFLESTRGISTTLEQPELGSTPFLSELARTSLVAENAYTVVPHTSKALASAHCGVAPPLDMLVTESRPNGLNAPCLPELLGQHGYRSAFFQSATEHYDDRRGLVEQLGYDDFRPVDEMPTEDHERANYFGYEDDIMLGPSREWLAEHGEQPFLTGYLTVTAHHDYRVPSSIEAEELSEDPELNDYLNTLRYQDRFVERLFDQYRELGLYDDTVFVVMADHGEGFGEHGLRQHDNTVYEEGVKIPLLVHDPADLRRRAVERPVSNTAVLPTVADRLGYAVHGRPYPSSSLDADGEDPVRIACYVSDHCLASIRGTQKYIFHFGRKADELFDLAEDPGEQHNLLSLATRAETTELRDDLLRWRAGVRELTASRS